MKFFEMKLKEQRDVLLEITPEITAIVDEITAIRKMQAQNNLIEEETEKESVKEQSVTVIKDVVDLLLVRRFDNIIRIVAALDGVTPEWVESEKSLLDIGDMIFDTLSNERLSRFFPRLRLLTQKTQSAI